MSFAASENPAPGTVFMAHAILAVVQVGLVLEMCAQLALRLRNIVGMNAVKPTVAVVRNLVVFEAEHAFPAGRKPHGVLGNIPVPDPFVAPCDCELPSLFALA